MFRRFWFSLLAALVAALASTAAQAQQASITLTGSDVALCLHNDTSWELTKAVSDADAVLGTVTWTVTATRGATSNNILQVNGFVAIKNTGTADATIGNIVVNLQRKNGNKWKSASVDVANAFAGDAATSANVVAAATDTQVGFNYIASGPQGTFKENAASGALEFTDLDDNTVWALTPEKTIPPGATVNLLFRAKFDNFTMNIPVGEQVRSEIIVSFGNAGNRGNGGASATNIDINGDGSPEALVRSVPTRLTRNVPALEACNDTVTLQDTGLTTLGTVSYDYDNVVLSSESDYFAGIRISATTIFSITAIAVAGGADGGSICNEATLVGDSSSVAVVIGYDNTDPLFPLPITVDFACCHGVDLTASACKDIDESEEGFLPGDYCTYTKGGYAGSGVPGQLFDDNFLGVFSSGLTIGINDAGGPRHHALWAATAGQANLQSFLTSSVGGGQTDTLTGDTTNATSTSGKNLARQTAALTLNIGFDTAGVSGGTGTTNLADLKLCNLHGPLLDVDNNPIPASVIGTWTLTTDQAAALNGTSISDVLADANQALGGNGIPDYVGSFGDLNQLVTKLNESFDNCEVSAFATKYLCKP
jgi:hypothetical protein